MAIVQRRITIGLQCEHYFTVVCCFLDPIVKAKVRHYLSTPVQFRGEMNLTDLIAESLTPGSGGTTPLLEPGGDFACCADPPALPPPVLHPLPLENVTRTNGESGSGEDTPNGTQQPKFEAFVMTGDRVLKICRTQQGEQSYFRVSVIVTVDVHLKFAFIL